ncbi:apolipoprotein D-like [Patella vulgata]|uniref:apolipoprotein D-like n=1 Tax=Patella vulgata TaxID=6465 RepID=UPI0024A7C67B|nr:apolipoprotein D-like [Patella vulgata]
METLILVVLACFTSALAQVPGFGGCPDAKPLAHLDLNRYLGKWYELYKMPNLFEGGQTCVTANYSVKANGHIKVYNHGFTNGEAVWAEDSPYAPYWVLDTDYDNYSAVFSCESLGGLAHVEFAWILSRNNTISDSLKQKIFKIFEKNGVGTTDIKKTVQDNCGKDV